MPDSDQHTHEHPQGSELSEMQLRVRTLESILSSSGGYWRMRPRQSTRWRGLTRLQPI